MRRPAIAVTAGLLLTATAYPASAEVWQGDAFIIAKNAACNANNWAVGDFFRSVIRPANVGTNDANTRLTLIGARIAQRFQMANQALDGT